MYWNMTAWGTQFKKLQKFEMIVFVYKSVGNLLAASVTTIFFTDNAVWLSGQLQLPSAGIDDRPITNFRKLSSQLVLTIQLDSINLTVFFVNRKDVKLSERIPKRFNPWNHNTIYATKLFNYSRFDVRVHLWLLRMMHYSTVTCVEKPLENCTVAMWSWSTTRNSQHHFPLVFFFSPRINFIAQHILQFKFRRSDSDNKSAKTRHRTSASQGWKLIFFSFFFY